MAALTLNPALCGAVVDANASAAAAAAACAPLEDSFLAQSAGALAALTALPPAGASGSTAAAAAAAGALSPQQLATARLPLWPPLPPWLATCK